MDGTKAGAWGSPQVPNIAKWLIPSAHLAAQGAGQAREHAAGKAGGGAAPLAVGGFGRGWAAGQALRGAYEGG